MAEVRSLLHRDLKPSNVMVVGGPAFAGFKITDFGIAVMAEQEIGDAGAGSASVHVPRDYRDFRKAGKPADIWALGAIAFELISGEKPFALDTRLSP